MIHYFPLLNSSNDEAALLKYKEGDIIWAECQSQGRGQRGHSWSSAEGMNLTFSAIFEPKFLQAQEQFLLLEVVALAMVDSLKEYGISAQIKWTNDIYVAGKKIVGILMEHKLQGSNISRTIAGIGLNVNQCEFDASLPNPTSMRSVTQKEYARQEVLECIIKNLNHRFKMLRCGERERLHKDYHEHLYLLGCEHTYALPDGSRFRGTIMGVETTGELKILTQEGIMRRFAFKDVEFVLKN